jgi:hypothetical protein
VKRARGEGENYNFAKEGRMAFDSQEYKYLASKKIN